ncbi:MAG: alpha/beta hydrolase [Deltaproteobacteria bacterium]|nr:alpha/beta hydrolase [Deltaproteobacteria bacterium]
MEKKVEFPSICGDLEGLYYTGDSEKGVVITHPHPQYGGDMYSPVVEAIIAAYRKLGFSTLRFNFRGAGNSAGHYDQGVGERDDVRAAVSFLSDRGLKTIHLSGYSFGAWVNAMTLQGGLAVQGMTMVAPPVAFIDFEDGLRLPLLSAVVAGSRDEIAPPVLIRPLMGQWNPDARIDIIDGADHFFFGFLDEVTRRLVQCL